MERKRVSCPDAYDLLLLCYEPSRTWCSLMLCNYNTVVTVALVQKQIIIRKIKIYSSYILTISIPYVISFASQVVCMFTYTVVVYAAPELHILSPLCSTVAFNDFVFFWDRYPITTPLHPHGPPLRVPKPMRVAAHPSHT
jgi:hypothetical protein